MIETSVMYVSAHTSVNVFRMAESATTIGNSTAGSVPNTNSRITSAPTPPMIASISTVEPPPVSCLEASPSASRPVTLTVMPAGSPSAAAARIVSAPLGASRMSGPAGYTSANAVWRSADTYDEVPGREVRARRARRASRPRCARSPARSPRSSSRRRWCGRPRRSGCARRPQGWSAFADLPRTPACRARRCSGTSATRPVPAAKAPKTVRTSHAPIISQRRRTVRCARRVSIGGLLSGWIGAITRRP